MLLHHTPRPVPVANTGDLPDLAARDVERVREAVDRLTPLDRDALLLRFRHRRTIEGIAEATQTTTAMVRVRVRRAAITVERSVGPSPAIGRSTSQQVGRPGGWSSNDQIEHARLGITPGLSVRLDAALRRGPAAANPAAWSRRLRRAGESLRQRSASLAVLAALGTMALMTVEVLAAAA